MTANNQRINDYPLPQGAMTIRYSFEFEEQQARIHAGLGLLEYDKLPGDPAWCDEQAPMSKAEVVVLYRMSRLIEAVQADAQAKQAKRGRR